MKCGREWDIIALAATAPPKSKEVIIMAKITKDTIVGDILDIAPEAAPIFMSIGMHCLGCPASRGETVEQACAVHGIPVDEVLGKLNQLVKD